MKRCNAEQNRNLNIMYIEDLAVEKVLSAGASTDKFWYILRQDGTLAGCIGSKEYAQICETKQIVFKTDYLYIQVGEGEKQAVIDIFTANPKIRKLPALDESGKLLYEYVRSLETYYADLYIQCGINEVEKQKNTRQENIIVSLTSYGKRLDLVHISIKSIMMQTMKADAIVLYLAEEDAHMKVRQEEELVKAGLQIKRNVKDLKSHKKYFNAMQEFPENLIITVDDDAIYDDRLIENLYAKHLEYPESVICGRGHRMTKRNGKVAPYDLWEGNAKSVMPEKGICATGVGGILYPCGKYREAFLDEEGIRETSLYGDDLWMKAVELIWGINTYAIGETSLRVIEGSQEEALYKQNVYNRRNDDYLDKIQRYFNINLAELF